MNPVDRGAEIKRPRAQRISGTARHEARKVRLALDHVRRWRAVGPFRLAGDFEQSLPLKAVASDTDAVADRPVVSLHKVEVTIGGIDDDGARRFIGSIEHPLPSKRGGQLLLARIRY